MAKKKTKKTAKRTAKNANAKKPAGKKLSQLEAAVKVLGQAKKPMNCKAMVEAMARKGLWKTPGGQTPASTLYAAILREINQKGKEARFKKVDRGQFALNR